MVARRNMVGRFRMLERELYEPVYNYLHLGFRDRLHPARGDLRSIIAITANSGGNATGLWSKPDLCMISLSRQKYGITWKIDLHGFEVKPLGCCTVQSVHEALNHTSLVNFTYLVWHTESWSEASDECSTILSRCAHYGVGLITFSNAHDLRSYALRLPGRRHEPAPDAFDEFVETRLSKDDRTKLLDWITELRR
jgi:hypothetical protein